MRWLVMLIQTCDCTQQTVKENGKETRKIRNGTPHAQKFIHQLWQSNTFDATYKVQRYASLLQIIIQKKPGEQLRFDLTWTFSLTSTSFYNPNSRKSSNLETAFCFCNLTLEAVLSYRLGEKIRVDEAHSYNFHCPAMNLSSQPELRIYKNGLTNAFQTAILKVSCFNSLNWVTNKYPCF